MNKRQGSNDPEYFNQILEEYKGAMHTIEVLSNQDLMNQIAKSAKDIKSNELFSADEIFAEE